MSNHADSSAQPKPTGNGNPVTVEVIKDILDRRERGILKYGTELRTDNGRDALIDLYQELLDAVHYTKQALMERDTAQSAVSSAPPIEVRYQIESDGTLTITAKGADGTMLTTINKHIFELMKS